MTSSNLLKSRNGFNSAWFSG